MLLSRSTCLEIRVHLHHGKIEDAVKKTKFAHIGKEFAKDT